MRARHRIALMLPPLVPGQAAMAQSIGWSALDIAGYHSFVQNWTPDNAPLCAALSSSGDWEKVLHPAPTLFSHAPYAPAESFWKHHTVLLVARVIDTGPTAAVFTGISINREGTVVTVSYRFIPNAKASSQIKWPLMLSVAKLPAGTVRFVENGHEVCLIRPGRSGWISPSSMRR